MCCSPPSAERLHDFRVLVTLGKPASPIGYDAADICRYHKGAMKAGQAKILTCKRPLPGTVYLLIVIRLTKDGGQIHLMTSDVVC